METIIVTFDEPWYTDYSKMFEELPTKDCDEQPIITNTASLVDITNDYYQVYDKSN